MEFRVLGPLEASERGRAITLGPPKQRALLARLLLDANRTVSAERLIDDLWGDELPDSAAKMVQIYVSGLRKVLPDGLLRTRAPGYVLEVEPDAIDLLRFDAMRARARAALEAGDPHAAAALLREGLALWRGPALAEFDEPFAVHERARLEELRLACVSESIEAELALGRHDDVIPQLEALVAREPLREPLQGQLMLALYRAGRQADALAAYQEFRRRLDEQLGLDPSPRLRALERSILMQDPDLDHAPVAPRPAPVALAQAGPAVPAPVGREAELERLRRALGQALAGRRRAVFVTGDPGTGKSTLVTAFAEQVAGEVFVARGECVEHSGAGEPYLPLLDALGRCVASGGEEMLARLRERAPTWLVQTPWLVDAAELEALERRVGGTTRERMLREMIEALEELATHQPILLVLEDLQWSDGATLDLLAALLRRSAPARILFVATCAPPRVLAGEDEVRALVHGLCLRGTAEELSLGRLDTTAVAAHLAQRFGGGDPPEGLAELLRERTGGNPLFIGQLVEHWLSEGAIASGDDGLRLARPLSDLAVGLPETLRAWLEDRVAELPGDDAELLRAASLVGREFAVAAVAAALERPDADVAVRCAALARGNALIEPAEEVRWADGTVSPGYRFAHDVHREVLAELLSPEERVAAHRRIGARLLEAQGDAPPANATDLARHFLAGRDPARAVRFLKLAAERAFARRAHREGIAHVRAALEAAGQLPRDPGRTRWEVELHSMLGQAVVAVDGWSAAEAERCLLTARELAEGLHDNEPLTNVLLALATLYEVRGEYARAAHIVEVDGAGLLPLGDGRGSLQTQELLACSLFHQGSFARALEHADQGVSLFDPADPDSGGYDTFPGTLGDDAGVTCHDWAALAMWFIGRPDSALTRAQHALELSADPVRAHSRATACAQLAVVHQCRREPEQVVEWAGEAIAAARERGFAYRVAMGRVLRGWAVARLGERERGIDEIACGMRASRATGGHMDDPYYLALLAEAYLDAGELDAGLSAVAEALEIGRRERSLFFEAELLRLRALLVLRGDGADLDAEGDLHAAIAIARRQGSPSLELRAALDLARLRMQAGRLAEARGAVAPLLESFDEGHDTPDLREAAALIAVPAAAS